ncbi:MAG: Rieske (2Fe-2S) protein [Anaerolineales bacterium]|nr:Rieske (2Fe-2S) protein [Anaerolineales bacterium]
MSKRIFLVKLSDFPANNRAVFNVEGHSILVIRVPDGFRAVANRCPHLGLPLAGGKVEGDTITCPFHNSQFHLSTGENLDWVRGLAGIPLPNWSRRLLLMGKRPAPLATYPVVVEDDNLYVEI